MAYARLVRSLLAPLGVGLALSTLAACSLFTKLDGYSSGEREIASDGAAPAPPVDSGAASTTDAGGPPGYRDVVLADRPLAYYRLGDTGAVARDEIGAHDGTYEGAVPHAKGAIAGDGDGAAVFDGSTFVRIGEAFAFLDHAPFSLEAWISVGAALPDTTQCVVAKNITGTPGAGPQHGWAMYLYGTDGRIQASRYHDGVEEEVFGDPIAVGRWTHVVATYDGTELAVYVDGEPTGRGPSPSPISAFVNDLTIGASRGGTACRFRGMIDELAIYDAPLSSARIRAHHRAGIGP